MISIRSVYPRRGADAIDAIAAYNGLLVDAFRRSKGIAAAVCEPRDIMRTRSDVLLVQYNPFSYGRWGLAPDLVLRLAVARLRTPRSHISLIIHEPYVAVVGPRTALMAAWQRIQLFALSCLADSVVVPSSDAARRLGRVPRAPVVVPVGSNLPDRHACRDEERRKLGLDPSDVVLVVFGASAAGRSMAHVTAAARSAAEQGSLALLLVLGAGHATLGEIDGVDVKRPGAQPAEEVARLLAAGDLFLAPYDDGVSTRRGALMAALQHGLAVVGTTAGRSDTVLAGSLALHLAPIEDVDAFAKAVAWLAEDDSERRRRASAARQLYIERFDWDMIAEQLLAAIGEPR